MTLTQEARALAERLDSPFQRLSQAKRIKQVMLDMARVIEQQDALLLTTVAKPVRDALLGGSL